MTPFSWRYLELKRGSSRSREVEQNNRNVNNSYKPPAPESSTAQCVRPCTRVRARCVCAGAVFARQRVACEELDMSFRGIRHLKREQVKATELGIKHQHLPEQSKADENISSGLRTSHIYFISPGFIIWLYESGARREPHL